jgi:hypothetical protein
MTTWILCQSLVKEVKAKQVLSKLRPAPKLPAEKTPEK